MSFLSLFTPLDECAPPVNVQHAFVKPKPANRKPLGNLSNVNDAKKKAIKSRKSIGDHFLEEDRRLKKQAEESQDALSVVKETVSSREKKRRRATITAESKPVRTEKERAAARKSFGASKKLNETTISNKEVGVKRKAPPESDSTAKDLTLAELGGLDEQDDTQPDSTRSGFAPALESLHDTQLARITHVHDQQMALLKQQADEANTRAKLYEEALMRTGTDPVTLRPFEHTIVGQSGEMELTKETQLRLNKLAVTLQARKQHLRTLLSSLSLA